MSHKFEDRIVETLSELARSCRSLVNRSRTIADLAAEDTSLGLYSQQSRMFSNLLTQALESLEADHEQVEAPTGLTPAKLSLGGIDIKGASGGMLNAVKLPSPEGSVQKAPALSGTTAFMQMSDLIGFLGTLDVTGTLKITTFDESFTIVFRDGRLTHAVSDNAPDGGRLGDVLVDQGALSEIRLSSFLLRNRDSKRKLGEALMLEEQVTERELFAALEEQIRRLFMRLFAADGASFEFIDNACPEEAITVKMCVPGLLLESMIAMDQDQQTAHEEALSACLDVDIAAPLPSESAEESSEPCAEGCAVKSDPESSSDTDQAAANS